MTDAQTDDTAPGQAVPVEPAADTVTAPPAKALAKLERLRCRVRARQGKSRVQDRVIRGRVRITRRGEPLAEEHPGQQRTRKWLKHRSVAHAEARANS